MGAPHHSFGDKQHSFFGNREFDAFHDETGRDGIFGGRDIDGDAFSVGGGEVFDRFEPAKCPAFVFCFHHLSTAFVRVDGRRKIGDLTELVYPAIDSRAAKPIVCSAFAAVQAVKVKTVFEKRLDNERNNRGCQNG